MPKFNEQTTQEIVSRLIEKAPGGVCPLCHTDDFGLMGNGVIVLPLQSVYPDPYGLVKKESELALVAMICKNCGNTFLIHLKTLGGLDHLTGGEGDLANGNSYF